MFSQNPNATPIWLLIIFSAISYFGIPRVKKIVSKYVKDEEMQRFYTFLVWLVVLALVVTLSIIIYP